MSGDRFDFLAKKLDAIRENDGFRKLIPREHDSHWLVESSGRRLVNFGANDYLGLASRNVDVRDAKAFVNQSLHPGSGASALVSGYTPLHQTLCESLASLEQTEAAVVFPSGYAACSGTPATLAEEGDLLISDSLNHASLIDGCRLSRATRFTYPHGSVEGVKKLLERNRHKHARAWIVTDGVFGMDGDVAPLESICDLADQFDAHVIVDEAHGTGVLGKDGSGCCEELGVKHRVMIRIGTMSKAFGSHGGFVVGPRVVIDYLINRCRPLIFSTAGSPMTIAASIRAVQCIKQEPSLRKHVRFLATHLREHLQKHYPSRLLATVVPGVPIVPLIVGANADTMRLAAKLNEAGFFVPGIRPPTVPKGTARLRISLSASHTIDDVNDLVAAIAESL